MKNLKRAGAVDEGLAGAGDQRKLERDAVAIAGIVAMKRKAGIESAREIEELPHGDARLACVGIPLGHRIAHALIEAQQSVLGRGECAQIPKRLRAAVDLVRLVGAVAVRVVLEDSAAILHHEHGDAAVRGGICRRGAETRQIECERGQTRDDAGKGDGESAEFHVFFEEAGRRGTRTTAGQ